MELTLEKKDASDWAYRGEGAANLVLAYSGSSPYFIGKVLRIQKAIKKESEHEKSRRTLTVHEELLWKESDNLVSAPNKEVAGKLYVEQVIGPFLGPKYVDFGISIPASREFLELIEHNVTCKRPAWRVDAAKVDTLVDSVLLLSDHSLFPDGTYASEPCICVEIKPKWGCLPVSEYIDEENLVKLSVPRYRMHQALKLHEGEISAYSEYDPLDLFSGSKERIHKAVKDLFTNPQNNLRVFSDGSLVYGILGANLVVQETLEDALKGFIKGDQGLRTSNFLRLISETIYTSGVMDRLLEAQKLDKIDIEGAIHAYYNVISEPCKVCRKLGKEKLQKSMSLHSISMDESLRIVKDYLIAATAKDCSVMMSFRLRKEEILGSSYNNVYLETTNQSYDYKVCFIDLDMKPLRKMEEYYEKDQKIVRCYTQMVAAMQKAEKITYSEVCGNAVDG